jgi:hypothetical protein
MTRIQRSTLSITLGAAAMMAAAPGGAAAPPAPPVHLEFADGRIVCEIVPEAGAVPELVVSTLRVVMRTALEHLGPPPEPARLTVRLLKPRPFYKRPKMLFHAEALAMQQGDEIFLHPGDDPLRLAFRLGHEIAHWLVYTQYPVRPPLWLDEGLANWTGRMAAEAVARPLKQTVERPEPAKLERHLFTLDELLALTAYPRKPAEVGAFYWQAESLVAALHQKLGQEAFRAYLAKQCVPEPPPWDVPLRTDWYFNDADFRWLAEQIRPTP